LLRSFDFFLSGQFFFQSFSRNILCIASLVVIFFFEGDAVSVLWEISRSFIFFDGLMEIIFFKNETPPILILNNFFACSVF